jgi:hypothetical protein
MGTYAIAQTTSANYYSSIKSYNLSKVWLSGKIHSVDVGTIDTEPLGFIGGNYQRFYIHYTSIVKDLANPYKYIVEGKTKVKDHICSFTGTITVIKAVLFNQSDDPKFKEGRVTCLVDFKEDTTQSGVGHMQGTLITDWLLDKQHNINYDTINSEADGFKNNQCKATWTSFKTHQSKRCNWGDFRIPSSGDLDIGAGEFSVNEKYVKNGWENYMKMLRQNKPQYKTELAEENRKWWE